MNKGNKILLFNSFELILYCYIAQKCVIMMNEDETETPKISFFLCFIHCFASKALKLIIQRIIIHNSLGINDEFPEEVF